MIHFRDTVGRASRHDQQPTGGKTGRHGERPFLCDLEAMSGTAVAAQENLNRSDRPERSHRSCTENSSAGTKKCPTGLRRAAKSWELRKAVFPPPLFLPEHRLCERGACPAPALNRPQHCPPRAKKRDYFLAFAFAGAAFAFGLAVGAAFFTATEDFAAAAFFAGAAFLAGAAFFIGAVLAGAAFFVAGFAGAFAAGFLAGAALALAGAAFVTAGFAAAFAAGFLAGAAFALAAAFGLAAGAAFFTAAAAFAATAFTGAFFAGAFFAGDLDAGALDDCLAISCPLVVPTAVNDPARNAYLTRACLASEALA